ncbi:unnamed protein product [Amoebophrya sp. A25]|nr:unnamed protein product [Amoebophrya sp. A25]|eukprot:GSA25T00003248001.1
MSLPPSSTARGAGAAEPGGESKSGTTGFIRVEARNRLCGDRVLCFDKVAASVTAYEMKRIIAIKLSVDPEHSGPPIPACLIHMKADTEERESDEEQEVEEHMLSREASERGSSENGDLQEANSSCRDSRSSGNKTDQVSTSGELDEEHKSLLSFLGLISDRELVLQVGGGCGRDTHSSEENFCGKKSGDDDTEETPILSIKLCYLVAQPKWQSPRTLQEKEALVADLSDYARDPAPLDRDSEYTWLPFSFTLSPLGHHHGAAPLPSRAACSTSEKQIQNVNASTCFNISEQETKRDDGEVECKILYFFSSDEAGEGGEEDSWKQWRSKLIFLRLGQMQSRPLGFQVYSWPRLFPKAEELIHFMGTNSWSIIPHICQSRGFSDGTGINTRGARLLRFIGPQGVHRILATERMTTQSEKDKNAFRDALFCGLLDGFLRGVLCRGRYLAADAEADDRQLSSTCTTEAMWVLRAALHWFPSDIFEEVLGATAVGHSWRDIVNCQRQRLLWEGQILVKGPAQSREIRHLFIEVLRKGETDTAEMLESLGFESVMRIARAEVRHATSPTHCSFFLAVCLAISGGFLTAPPDEENVNEGRDSEKSIMFWMPILDLHEFASDQDWFPTDIWRRKKTESGNKRRKRVYRFCCVKKKEWFSEVFREVRPYIIVDEDGVSNCR